MINPWCRVQQCSVYRSMFRSQIQKGTIQGHLEGPWWGLTSWGPPRSTSPNKRFRPWLPRPEKAADEHCEHLTEKNSPAVSVVKWCKMMHNYLKSLTIIIFSKWNHPLKWCKMPSSPHKRGARRHGKQPANGNGRPRYATNSSNLISMKSSTLW